MNRCPSSVRAVQIVQDELLATIERQHPSVVLWRRTVAGGLLTSGYVKATPAGRVIMTPDPLLDWLFRTLPNGSWQIVAGWRNHLLEWKALVFDTEGDRALFQIGWTGSR